MLTVPVNRPLAPGSFTITTPHWRRLEIPTEAILMNRTESWTAANTSTFVLLLTAALCVGLVTPLLAAPPVPATASPLSSRTNTPTAQSAEKCTTDLRSFAAQIQTDGYWLHGAGLGYGYPYDGYGYGNGFGQPGMHAGHGHAGGHWLARPSYEVRTLIASATILAERGQQQVVKQC